MDKEKFNLACKLANLIKQKEEQEARLLDLLRKDNVIEAVMLEHQKPDSALEDSDIVEMSVAIKREIQTRIGLVRDSLRVMNQQFEEI